MSKLIFYAGAWRTAEAIEARKIRDRARKKKQYDENPDAERLKSRAKYQKNLEKERLRHKNQYEANKGAMNARRIEWGRRNVERQREIARNFRNRSDGSRGIRSATESFRKGELSLDGYINRIEQHVAEHNERLNERFKRRRSKRWDSKA